MFILNVDREVFNQLIEEIRKMDNVELFGKSTYNLVDGPSYRRDIDFSRQIWEAEDFGVGVRDQTADKKETAERLVRDLSLCRLSCFDYSDYVTLEINRRKKEDTNKQAILINRTWSKANNSGSGIYHPVMLGKEKIVISGECKRD